MPAYTWESKPDKSRKYDLSVVSLETIEEAKEKYQNSKEWQNFAKLGIKNPFLKKILLDKYFGICQFCHRPINNKYVLHHLTYSHACPQPCIQIPSPTPKHPERTLNLPDCENCEEIEKCIKKLVPVHPLCNKLISDIRHLMLKEGDDNI